MPDEITPTPPIPHTHSCAICTASFTCHSYECDSSNEMPEPGPDDCPITAWDFCEACTKFFGYVTIDEGHTDSYCQHCGKIFWVSLENWDPEDEDEIYFSCQFSLCEQCSRNFFVSYAPVGVTLRRAQHLHTCPSCEAPWICSNPDGCRTNLEVLCHGHYSEDIRNPYPPGGADHLHECDVCRRFWACGTEHDKGFVPPGAPCPTCLFHPGKPRKKPRQPRAKKGSKLALVPQDIVVEVELAADNPGAEDHKTREAPDGPEDKQAS